MILLNCRQEFALGPSGSKSDEISNDLKKRLLLKFATLFEKKAFGTFKHFSLLT